MDSETPDKVPAPSATPEPAVTNPVPDPTASGPVVSGSSDNKFKKLLLGKPMIAAFVVLFAGVGGYLIFSSFADSITQTKTWQTAAQWTAGNTLDHVVAADSGVTLAVASPATTTSPATTNLALKHRAVASSTESRRLPASAAFDGNTGTRWGSYLGANGGRDPEWIYVDLGSVNSISEVKLQWETAYGKAYQIQVSNDAKNWTTIYSTTTGDGGIDDLTGLNGTGRYVRMYGTKRATQWGYSLWEFAVYGGTKSTPATYAPAGSITLGFDADAGTTSTAAVTWNSVTPQATMPTGTNVTYQYATSTDNKTWSAWSGSMTTLPHTRYLQIRANLSTANTAVTPTLTSLQLTYTITTTPPPTTPAPTVTLTAAPSSVASGATSTLTWSSTNATTCTASGAWSGAKATSGTTATSALTQSSTYTLSCTGAGGAASANATVTVSAPPVSSGSTSGGCTSNNVVAPCIGDATTAAAGWGTPKFDDEFNGTSLNPTYWASSWFNGGSMNDVSTSASNVAVSGGNLILTLSSGSVGALVNTNPNDAATTGFSFGYGYAEARVFFPGSGSTIYNWPAWWTDGQSWPANGEIDIAEGLGPLTSNYHSTSGANNSGAIAGTWAGAFHTYGVDREPGKNSIYWDGKLVRSYSTNDNGAPHYLIFNVGSGNVTGAASQMKVDYVRVWQK